MKKQLVDLYIEPLTIVYIALSLLLGRFTFVFGMFLITIIHEFAHVFAAFVFKLKISLVKVTPLGCYANIENLDQAKRIEQIIILISGPLSYFFSGVIIKYLYQIDLISIYRVRELMDTNLLIMVFNLLPIFPLDGGRILKIMFSSLFNEKNSLRINAILGFFMAIVITIYLFKAKQYLFGGYILLISIKNVFSSKKDYLKFLYQRLFYQKPNHFKERINRKKVIYRYANNYCLTKNGLINEDVYITQLIYKEK